MIYQCKNGSISSRFCCYLKKSKTCKVTIIYGDLNRLYRSNWQSSYIKTKYHLNPLVLNYIKLLANSENYPLDLYYETLKQNPEVLLLKLSNRAHTCTTLIDSSPDEIKSYVEECEKYIYPLCEYGIKHYPMHANSIQIMLYHISSVCNIVKSLTS